MCRTFSGRAEEKAIARGRCGVFGYVILRTSTPDQPQFFVCMGEVRLRGLSISIDAVRISGNFRNEKVHFRWGE